jgi:hypothetical protein
MPTPDELRAELGAARNGLADALRESSAATWERKPEQGTGEDAWSAREAAQHVIGSEIFYANAVCEACGYDGPESPFDGRPQLETPEAAQAALQQAIVAADSKIRHVTETDLEKQHERMGPLPDVFASWTGHLRDHAAQIQAAAGQPSG